MCRINRFVVNEPKVRSSLQQGKRARTYKKIRLTFYPPETLKLRKMVVKKSTRNKHIVVPKKKRPLDQSSKLE